MILLVHPDRDLEELVQEHPAGAVVHRVRDRKGAETCLEQEHFELVIAHADIPEDRKAAPEDRGGGCGLKLLKGLRGQSNDVPFILIVPAGSEDAYAVQDIPRARFVWDGPNMMENLVDTIQRLREPGAEEEEHRVELDISLDLDRQFQTWQLAIHDGKVSRFPIQPLNLDREAVQDILHESKHLPKMLREGPEAWQEALTRVGRHLAKAIFEANPKLLSLFERNLTPERLEAARIRFTVTKQIYPAILEAILTEDEDFWMLKAPVYRRLEVPQMQNRPLFRFSTDNAKLNCLIVESHADGPVEQLAGLDGGNDFPELTHIADEADSLERFLRESAGVGEVLRLSGPAPGQSFRKTLQETLLKPRNDSWTGWHLVHYAGHSVYDEKGVYRSPSGEHGAPGTGYVLLPDHPADCLDAQTFANWLGRGGVQFLYLSSCRSSEEDFAFELARKMVPAVVGFRWEVDDQAAREFTDEFYRNLFEKRSLESAFYQARRDIAGLKPTDPVWAAPVLIVQVELSETR